MHNIPTLFCGAVYSTRLFAGLLGRPAHSPAHSNGQIYKLGGVFCRTPMSHASASNGLWYMKDANQNAPYNQSFTGDSVVPGMNPGGGRLILCAVKMFAPFPVSCNPSSRGTRGTRILGPGKMSEILFLGNIMSFLYVSIIIPGFIIIMATTSKYLLFSASILLEQSNVLWTSPSPTTTRTMSSSLLDLGRHSTTFKMFCFLLLWCCAISHADSLNNSFRCLLRRLPRPQDASTPFHSTWHTCNFGGYPSEY
jgi:hypothetical protein